MFEHQECTPSPPLAVNHDAGSEQDHCELFTKSVAVACGSDHETELGSQHRSELHQLTVVDHHATQPVQPAGNAHPSTAQVDLPSRHPGQVDLLDPAAREADSLQCRRTEIDVPKHAVLENNVFKPGLAQIHTLQQPPTEHHLAQPGAKKLDPGQRAALKFQPMPLRSGQLRADEPDLPQPAATPGTALQVTAGDHGRGQPAIQEPSAWRRDLGQLQTGLLDLLVVTVGGPSIHSPEGGRTRPGKQFLRTYAADVDADRLVTPSVVTLTVWGVPARRVPAAIARMGLDRLHLRGTPGLRFAKLLGTGDGRTFTLRDADPLHWALLTVWDDDATADRFATMTTHRRWNAISDERLDVRLSPLVSRGRWAGKEPFTPIHLRPGQPDPGPVASITRARLRPTRAFSFWRAVPPVSADLATVNGLELAIGIGEAPIGLQGTFSLWRSNDALNDFAHRRPAHADVIRRTGPERWYSEELFARFTVRSVTGTFAGRKPLDDASTEPGCPR